MSKKNRSRNKTAKGFTRHVRNSAFKRKILIAFYGAVCLRCRQPLTDAGMTLDHVLPASKGGKGTINNLQILCEDCNNSKGNRIGDYRPWPIVKFICENSEKIYEKYTKKV